MGRSFDDLRQAGYRDLQKGQLQSALALAQEGQERARAQHPALERAFQVLEAEVLASQQRNAEALVLLQRGLAAPTPADVVRVRGLMTRGLVRCRAADNADAYRQAHEDLAEAARVAAALGSTELAGEVALRRGTCRFRQRDWAAAEVLFLDALGAARRDKMTFLEANAAGSLGIVRIQTARYDEATTWLRRSLDLASSIGADTPRIKTMNNLGWCYYKLGDYERALSLFTRAEELATSRGLAGDRVSTLTNVGNTYFKQGDYERAAEHYRRAFGAARELGQQWDAALLVGNLGEIALELGRYDEAEASVGEALRIMEKLRDEAERQRLVLTQADIFAARGEPARADTLYRMVMASPHTESGLLWQAQAALARLHVKAGKTVEAEDEFRRAFALMERMRSTLREADHRITFFSSLRRFHDDYVGFLVGSGRANQALEVADRSRARLLRERLGQHAGADGAATVARFRQAARSLDAVLLAYWTGPQRSLLWIVTAQGVELRTLPSEAALRRDVSAYQAAILRSRDTLAEMLPAGERLWSALVAPAAEQIRTGARVIVIPDGPLHQLNFETLVVPGPNPHYWIEDVTVASAPSLSLLGGNRRPRRASDPRLLIIGDPVPPNEEFPRLAHAKGEVAGIAELFEPARRTVFSGAEAEPAVYRRAGPGRFALIHFAAHATANRESPLESAVVLSARNDAYKLYARDVIGVPLRAELVTLSACRSAGSRAYAGEGLVGLAWAFLSSGAANVIGGLWNVEDASTSELMEHLYRGIRDGLDPAEALRAAKLRLLRSGTAYRKPFYWAPFVIYTRSPTAPS